MTNEEILRRLANVKKGRYVALKKVKDLGEGITKESDMVIRLGVAYSNLKVNEEKETGSLPWGHWVEGLENLVIEHTKKDKQAGEETTNYYLRVTSTNPENPEEGNDVIATRYFKDGMIVSREYVCSVLGEKKMETSTSPVYNLKFDNILDLSVR